MQMHRHNVVAVFYFITITIIHVLADDAAVMAKLAKSFFPTPPGWFGNNPCRWSGVECDKSGHVTSITLSFKSLSGQLPQELNFLTSLTTLNLQGNKLSGTLPSLSNLASLQEAYFDANNFTSFQSGFLSGLTNLQTFSISQNINLLPWTIPESLTDSTTLVTFEASKANIMGTIPDIFGSFPSLQSLRLSYNNISGSLPPSFGKSGIQRLWLNNQMTGLSGGLHVLAKMSQLTQAWLHVNKFTGPIPDLSGCVNLFDLQLRDNQLTGVIPASLTSLSTLTNVSLQNNIFQGPVPVFPNSVHVSLGNTNSFCNPSPGPCDPQVDALLDIAGALGYPADIAQSWTGNDPCQNWRYISCGSGSVIVINFAKQNFVGTISPAIANLTSLKTLMLSNNNLTGVIPASLTSLKYLQLLDVSYNNLSGHVPKFAPAVVVKTDGNPLIGVDVPSDSSDSSPDPSSGSPSSTVKKSNLVLWLFPVIAIVVVTIAVILGVVVYKRYMKNKREDYKSGKVGMKSKKSDEALAENNNGDFHMTVGVSVNIPIEVLVEATDNFNQENKIGEGGFGVVYKGKLHDGTQIAVKRMESSLINKAGISEFRAEIEVLSKVRHRNLVALHGFCVHGNDRLLVYEYMPQGSLEHHIFKWRQMGHSQPISWTQRISIALDVARGVEYLHSLTQQSFIHRDLKPSNILLGDDMKAKVSDFGLVKSAPDGKYSLETRLAGTFGYLAPEYAATGRVTTKVDVYAYGVILMELMTGQKALDDTLPEEKSHLVSWFRNVIVNSNNLVSCLDPFIESDEETLKSIYKVAELAGHCTAREPSQRPDMTHVVNVLSPLVTQWIPLRHDEEDENISTDLHMTLPQALAKWKASEGKSTSSCLYTSDDMSATFTTKRASDTTSSFSSPDGQ